MPWRKHMTLTIYYMTKSDRDNDWTTVNVLGTEAAVKF